MQDPISYFPAKALLPLASPRDVTVTITRKADGHWRTSMPVQDLDYLIALEWQRQLNLPGFNPRNLRSRTARRKPTTRTQTQKH